MTNDLCTCDLELNFGYHPDGARWEVIDAECVVVATCAEERFARLVVDALNRLHTVLDDAHGFGEACVVHEAERGTR